MENIIWQANWIEPLQEEAITEKPLSLEEAVMPAEHFTDGTENLKPVKEIKFDFDLEKDAVGKDAFVYASAHGVYEIYINKKKAGKNVLAPETTNYNKLIWYQKIDISDLIKEGKNELVIFLADGWYTGRIGLNGESCQYGNRLAFIGQIEAGGKIIPVDKNAKSRDSFIKYADIYIGEKWDISKEPGEWQPCFEVDYPKDVLRPQAIPAMEYIKELPLKEIITTPEGDMVLDFGQVLAGVVELEASVNKKTVVVLDHSEVLDKKGNFKKNIIGRFKGQQDVFVLDERQSGIALSPRFTFHGFRYVRVKGIGAQDIKRACAKVIGTPLKKTCEFSTDNKDLNALQHAIEWSEISNMMSVPTDCPQRERMGWTGDILAFGFTGGFLFDLKNFLETWLYQVRLDQLENGEVPVVVPNHPAQEAMQKMLSGTSSSAAWSDVCVHLPWDLYMLYGDKKVLSDNFSMMKKWLSYVASVDWGSLFHFGDWLIPSLREDPEGPMKGAFATKELVAWCYYAMTLEKMVKICHALSEDEKPYELKLKETREKILETYVSEDGSVLNGTLQGAYVIAVKSGALDANPELKNKVLLKLVELIKENNYCLDTGFASVPYLLDVLYDNGFKETAFKVLFNKRQPGWLYMITKGATTIWENWNAIREDGEVTDFSYNHYAYGCVGRWIYEHIGGIKCMEPGFKKIKAAPDTELLSAFGVNESRIRFESVLGPIEVLWKGKDIKITAPEGVEIER